MIPVLVPLSNQRVKPLTPFGRPFPGPKGRLRSASIELPHWFSCACLNFVGHRFSCNPIWGVVLKMELGRLFGWASKKKKRTHAPILRTPCARFYGPPKSKPALSPSPPKKSGEGPRFGKPGSPCQIRHKLTCCVLL